MDIRLFGTAVDSIVDGPGLRYAVFVQGCSHGCKGCQNPESHAQDGGYLTSIDAIIEEIKANGLIQGVTLSGGEPLEQCEAALELARQVKSLSLSLWLYTGYRFEDILDKKMHPLGKELVSLCDVVVDGLYIEALHSYDLDWKGSSNQRLIDVSKSFEADELILWESKEIDSGYPSSW